MVSLGRGPCPKKEYVVYIHFTFIPSGLLKEVYGWWFWRPDQCRNSFKLTHLDNLCNVEEHDMEIMKFILEVCLFFCCFLFTLSFFVEPTWSEGRLIRAAPVHPSSFHNDTTQLKLICTEWFNLDQTWSRECLRKVTLVTKQGGHLKVKGHRQGSNF